MTLEITTGLLLVMVSVLGIIGCLIALAVTGPLFRRKRRKLLEKIESE